MMRERPRFGHRGSLSIWRCRPTATAATYTPTNSKASRASFSHLHVAKADFFGYSNGGHIALEIVLRHPEVVRSLILESAMFSRDGADPRFWQGFDHAKLDDMPLELRKAYLATAPHPEQLPSFFAKSVQRMREFKGWTPAQLQSIRRPTLVVVGDRDLVPALLLEAALATPVLADGGGLNACGCHFNRKTGECHCHRPRTCGCACEPLE
jgi:pimeloyl-ACP methyl ester carboxylesterase